MSSKLPEGLQIINPESVEEWEAYYQLRFDVLRSAWTSDRQSTRDERENKSVHFLVLDQRKLAIATGRLQLNTEEEGQIRSMAVHEKFQNQGIGHFVIQKIEEEARARKLKYIILDAREPALNFYLKNNYEVIADSYLLFGVIKHFKMKKEL